MQGENKALSAGGDYSLLCEVVGSRPVPTITWWKGSTLMKNSTDTVIYYSIFLSYSLKNKIVQFFLVSVML